MSSSNQTDIERETVVETGPEELTVQEVQQVSGAGLLSSPLGVRDTARGVWVREVVEDVEAY